MSDSALTEWGLKQVETHGLQEQLFAIGIVVILAIGGAYYIGWRHGLRSVTLDNRKKQGELLASLAANRSTFNAARESLNVSMSCLRDAILANGRGASFSGHVKSYRDEMCRIYEVEYLNAFKNYVEQIPALLGKIEACRRVRAEILPGLKTMCGFLKMANEPNLLKRIPSAVPFQLRRDARDGLFQQIQSCIPVWRIDLLLKLDAIQHQTEPFIRPE